MNPQTFLTLSITLSATAIPQWGMGYGGMGMMNPYGMMGMGGMFWDEKTHKYVKKTGNNNNQANNNNNHGSSGSGSGSSSH
jgi:hypothetical protein